MFDDVCMACGKQLDDGSLYCNEQCMSADRHSSSSYRPLPRSPSRSSASASSVFTSPYLNPNATPTPPFMSEIPPLMLPKKRTSSSSASSAITSEFEEEDRLVGVQSLPPLVDVKSEHVYRLPPLGVPDAAETTPIALSVKLSPSRRTPISALPLHFARRPAPTDTRSIVPSMHLRPEAKSHQSQQTLTPPRTLSHRHSRSHDLKFTTTPIPALLPKRNRASLPAYFSRLTLSAQVAPSPPTLSHIDVQVDTAVDVLATPKASSRRVVAPLNYIKTPPKHYPMVIPNRVTGPPPKEGLRKSEWGSPPTMPVRVPMPISRASSPSLERPRERARSRGERRDSFLGQREQRVEMERRGRSRAVTPRLHS